MGRFFRNFFAFSLFLISTSYAWDYDNDSYLRLPFADKVDQVHLKFHFGRFGKPLEGTPISFMDWIHFSVIGELTFTDPTHPSTEETVCPFEKYGLHFDPPTVVNHVYSGFSETTEVLSFQTNCHNMQEYLILGRIVKKKISYFSNPATDNPRFGRPNPDFVNEVGKRLFLNVFRIEPSSEGDSRIAIGSMGPINLGV